MRLGLELGLGLGLGLGLELWMGFLMFLECLPELDLSIITIDIIKLIKGLLE